ncbi:hypothetical protein PMAYCL1PPCAC_02447 [Pristionchus mayeri]|uniref:BTB domain-containing protein n=1 Tax=Pristionchus mayeri TaxID=1317129 RepID=A0AAN5C6Y5_9BILA|nr:hypothetical protein PMAYCL1PPCAC_02447 [Pristionchus mayeri]
MSRKMPTETADLDMQSLLEKVRRLEMENKRLKERSNIGEKASIVQRSVQIDMLSTPQNQKALQNQQTVDMGDGVTMTIYSLMNINSNQVTLWCEVHSIVEIDTTVIMTTGSKDAYGNKVLSNALVDFLRVSRESARGSKHSISYGQRGYHNQNHSLTIGVKMIRMTQNNALLCETNPTVTVMIQNQKLLVDVPYVSKWSEFLQAYFASNMKEKANGIYPIKDCSLSDFHEMLEVIYPSSKPIDENNVEAMLHLADRFIMPMLTRKCEVFLSQCTSHGISEIRMIGMADRFNLIRTRTIVLERLGSTALIRSKIIQAAGYESLSIEMKREIDARYVQLDVTEREGNPNRGY